MLTESEFYDKYLKNSDRLFAFNLLMRLESDVFYFLGAGNHNARHLWAVNDPAAHIQYMKYLWKYCKKAYGYRVLSQHMKYSDILAYQKHLVPEK